MSKLKSILDACENLLPEERTTLRLLLDILYPEVKPRGAARPSRRGRFVCDADGCTEVFRTVRGLGIHKGRTHKASP